MKNDNSYAELTKAYAQANLQRKEKFVQSIYIDTLIHESLLKRKRELLMNEIDHAIDQKNQDLFNQLANDLLKVDKELLA